MKDSSRADQNRSALALADSQASEPPNTPKETAPADSPQPEPRNPKEMAAKGSAKDSVFVSSPSQIREEKPASPRQDSERSTSSVASAKETAAEEAAKEMTAKEEAKEKALTTATVRVEIVWHCI